jgi:ribosome-associated protein
VTSSGSEAKILIAAGKILVNEEIETRRGRKLISGDIVMTSERSFLIKKETAITSCS